MNIQQIEEARALAPLVGHNITAVDTTPALVLQYVPVNGVSGSSTATYKVIKNHGVRLRVDGATPAGIDLPPLCNASGWLKFATITNMGQLRDALCGSIAWRAYLVCALRGDLASNLLATATGATASGANGAALYWDMKAETNIAAGFAISGEKFLNNGANGWVTDADDECENSLHFLEINLQGASDSTLSFYSASQAADTQIGGSEIDVAIGSATYRGKNTPADVYITANRGERLIARVVMDTEAKGTPTRFHGLGKTAVLRNDRMVDEVNY